MNESEEGGAAELEATGETVGEAKWTALREIERRFPGADRADVRFEVLSEGERGLLGIGHVPARVVARLAVGPPPQPPRTRAHAADSPPARLEELLERVCGELGVAASILVEDEDDALRATLSGPSLGLLIGKHGQTIDALQYLANAIVFRGTDERKEVVVDAAGYRERRRRTLAESAERAAERAQATGLPVALEPMTAVERKIVHSHLAERAEVETASEGAEPHRYVIVRPVPG